MALSQLNFWQHLERSLRKSFLSEELLLESPLEDGFEPANIRERIIRVYDDE